MKGSLVLVDSSLVTGRVLELFFFHQLRKRLMPGKETLQPTNASKLHLNGDYQILVIDEITGEKTLWKCVRMAFD